KSINKKITVEQVKETIDCFRENGIMSVVTWMVGFPDDDEQIIKERFQHIDTIDPDLISLQILTPVEGIPISEELTPYIVEHDRHKWDFHHAVVRTKYLSREDLGRLAAWCNREFYSKPGRIQRILYDKRFHLFTRNCARSYIECVGKFEKAAAEGKPII
ncbi:MAG: hypothetical protein SV062_08645, partial [Thermodesulfobacteriota bacterium]|nr:hypothetical protein [Thermodesulfobacteriota bacterium]